MAEPGDNDHEDVPDESGDVHEPLSFTVDEATAGRRLDVALSELCGESRAQVQRWIGAGDVLIGSHGGDRAGALGQALDAPGTLD